ncbi:PH domain-containing protein [Methanobrevibacter sp.]|uniref:PH domain-containing protein n=1 Tax=Methanobrevibacter sp. TaxID=66852 RepID=UPI0026DF93D8|nr:PH domain-containing protein [Methanobrevibacter sp.]MDO5860452.1 PH domain-containing protein [Methanobrevibacter sp.]
MLFDKNEDVRNERILYQTKPNMLLGCKKAIYGVVLLVIVLMVAPIIIKFIGEMQVYLISRINLALTRYAAIAFFVVILIIIIYIIWQLFGWYSKEYILTESKIIVKSGVLSTKKNYMPYSTIQDINTSQSIIGKLFNVGSINLFSAYDNNQMELSNIGNPSQAEEIIFSHMINSRNYNQPRTFPQANTHYERGILKDDDYYERNEYYDEFEPITPIGREKDNHPRREYEYYPDDLTYEENTRNTYEYEPYNDEYYAGENRLYDDSFGYSEPSNQRPQKNHHDGLRNGYSHDDYYLNNDSESYYESNAERDVQDKQMDADSSEKVIRRHFDKFKR